MEANVWLVGWFHHSALAATIFSSLSTLVSMLALEKIFLVSLIFSQLGRDYTHPVFVLVMP